VDKLPPQTNVAQWLSFADRLRATFREFHNVRMPRTHNVVSDVHLLGYSLLARTYSNFCGVVTLVREALVIEARTLTRSCLENSFYLVGLVKDGEKFVREMAAADVASRDVRGQTILRRLDLKGQQKAFDEKERQNVQAFLKGIRKDWPNARSIEPRKLAGKGPMAGGYLIYSQLSADAAHPSITSLNRYVTRERGVATLKFAEAPTNEELVDTLTWACVASIGAYIAGSELLGATELNEKIATRAEEYNRLANPNAPPVSPTPDARPQTTSI
jgi:hypothetical protein